MDFMERFRNFLGLGKRQEPPQFDDQQNRVWPPFEEPYQRDHSFNIFTDPLEMHRYFEQQMNEMLRNFGFGEFRDGFSFPQIEGGASIEELPSEGDELRGQYLKPGFDKPSTNLDKKDEDIDGKLDIRDWNSVFGHQQPKRHFFGQSIISKTIRNPDGTMETHSTVKDNEGNEETTITRRIGDKEYTIIKRRDKTGKEEIIENMVNMDEKEVAKLFSSQPQPPQLPDRPWPFFDRFFK